LIVQFKQITEAYEVLSDPKKKMFYDQFGDEGLKQAESISPHIFDQFVPTPTRGEDLIHKLPVSLEDLYQGTVKKLQLRKSVLCPDCQGYQYLSQLVFRSSDLWIFGSKNFEHDVDTELFCGTEKG
jgi:DnaJ-class molecular chaperone